MSLIPPPYIHGSTDDVEVARLIRQAAFVASFTLDELDAAPGARVLDLGTGVGAMAAEIARRRLGIQLTAVDSSPSQLARAEALHPVASYVLADATALPFADGSFDRVHASWLLEHVGDPLKVLAEVRRVLAPGGMAQIIEVDNVTLRIAPPLPELVATFELLNAAQVAAGGDPWIGGKLERLAREAGFARIECRSIALVGDDDHPDVRAEMNEEFAGICESLDETLSSAQLVSARDAARQLRTRGAGTRIEYRPVLLRAFV